MDQSQCPPAAPLVAHLAGIQALDVDVKMLLTQYQVPYWIQHQMGQQGFTTLADLADRYVDKATIRADAPREYQFRDGDNGFTAATSLRACIRLGQACEDAKARLQQRAQKPLTDRTTRKQKTARRPAAKEVRNSVHPKRRALATSCENAFRALSLIPISEPTRPY